MGGEVSDQFTNPIPGSGEGREQKPTWEERWGKRANRCWENGRKADKDSETNNSNSPVPHHVAVVSSSRPGYSPQKGGKSSLQPAHSISYTRVLHQTSRRSCTLVLPEFRHFLWHRYGQFNIENACGTRNNLFSRPSTKSWISLDFVKILLQTSISDSALQLLLSDGQ